ncbi:MAG: helix-turn-helix domain-containing protein [Acetatifactor muris]|nr:helix-turn-helix domain-containing protein [Acetatifactor muris]
MTVGENIRRIRKENGLTQKQLGELCQMNEVQIRQYELGKANPKIETVDKIASALGVNIVDIMERFTIEQYKSTSEYQRLEKEVNAEKGIIAILTDIYGKVEDKDLEGKYGSGHYYLVGEGSGQFILYDGDIDALYKSTKASIPSLVERMKDSRPEEEAVREYLKELDTPIPPEMIPDRFK